MNDKPKIRQFHQKDLLEINKIETKVFNKESYHPYTFLEYNTPKNIFYVVEKQNKIIGYVIITPTTTKNAKIISIAIDPEHQSQGIGTKLLKKAINTTKKQKTKKISLEVKKTNKKAIKFYRKLGFQKTKTKKQYYNNGEDAYYMTKKTQQKTKETERNKH
ncbi:ribosomal protein S18-alanine N-acetyltransferase [Methanonatronarchaeum sp. AMET-Sl]|uniref:ribosomal protein S18-alanine N-acetyltransferase n=1 Tax=Methanonatronarchaeum sp. AMET-Sl TaxID=3037654 RepID=UPI00244DA4DD|nr:ribosomal protein S18-alanine N-acetyltransferase [Methanonatronarchaeum sp. AMET-Sl]WGI17767.1 ribosomal protein S18-alanine N-acetyltransferase [Methanonatronarchaeum sp. AMET-Sl]